LIPQTKSGIVFNARKVITESMPETSENKDFEIRFLGRDKGRYNQEINQFTSKFFSAEKIKDTVLLVANPSYKAKLNQMCQSILNGNTEKYFVSDGDEVNKNKKWRKNDRIIWENDTEDPLVLKGTIGNIIDFHSKLKSDKALHPEYDSYFIVENSFPATRYYFVAIQFEDRSNPVHVSVDVFLENASLGYTLTVDESRGSSFAKVLCVLDNDSHTSSNLLYVAMMAATENFLLLVPSKEDLYEIISRHTNFNDFKSMLPEKFRRLISYYTNDRGINESLC